MLAGDDHATGSIRVDEDAVGDIEELGTTTGCADDCRGVVTVVGDAPPGTGQSHRQGLVIAGQEDDVRRTRLGVRVRTDLKRMMHLRGHGVASLGLCR